MAAASPILGSLLVVAATVLVIYLGTRLLWERKKNLPPGPRGLPIIGCMHMLRPPLHQTLQKMAGKYGPLMSLRIGQKLFVVASNAEAAREFFKFQDANFSSRPFKRAFQVLMPNDIAFVPGNTPLRRHLRKIFQVELTSAKRTQETEYMRTAEIIKLIKSLPERTTVTIKQYVEVMVTNVISLMVFKKQYLSAMGKAEVSTTAEQMKEIEEFKKIVTDIGENISANNLGDVVPALRWLDPQRLEQRYREAKARMDAFSTKIIAEHLARRKQSTGDHGEKDLIDVFLDQVDLGDEQKHKVTLENVQSILFNAIAAGLAPIVDASEWALTEVLRNPDILSKVRAELDDVVGTARLFRESDLPKMKYLQAVVNENFRLHPAPLPPPHESMEACRVLGYDIPAGTALLASFYAIQRDPAVWPDPLKYDPSRFVEGAPIHAGVGAPGQFDLIPFGSGRRSCPALETGHLMVSLIVAHLLHAFEWTVPDRAGLNDDQENDDHTASKAVALSAILTRRLQNSELFA